LKIALIAAAAASVLAVAAFSAPAMAQDAASNTGVTWYGNLGYTGIDAAHTDLSAVDGRIGARFGAHFGVEGEAAFGVGHENAGAGTNVRLNDEEAIYGVGYLPINPKVDLFARIGYGHQDFHFSGAFPGHENADSFNYGAGAQYFWDGKDGVRGEYTRVDSQGHGVPDANTWGINYVRKF
jgi:outer membrane immunogenic protein